jgi:hypothetical protein
MSVLDIRAVLVIAATGTLITAASLYVFNRLRQRPAVAMASFQLQPENVARDFQRLYYANILQAVVMVVYGTAALLGMETVTNLVLTLSVVYGVLVANIFYRWGRRF